MALRSVAAHAVFDEKVEIVAQVALCIAASAGLFVDGLEDRLAGHGWWERPAPSFRLHGFGVSVPPPRHLPCLLLLLACGQAFPCS